MRRAGGPASAIALFVLVALALPGLVSLAHDHAAPVLLDSLAELEVFAAGHERPDPSEHVEAATRVGTADCSVCLQRQRKSVEVALSPALLGSRPSDRSIRGAVALGLAAVARTKATPRAPPLA